MNGGQYYYYATNAQGDVTAILNTSGTAVVQYSYDAWGNPLEITGTHALATLNPLRYRGYVYDNETELYYLQSRYYNPETGRFLNADGFAGTGQGLLGNNMFSYCLNNPVNRVDISGDISIWYYLMIDSDWGFIHRMVQLHIISTNGSNLMSEFALPSGGRADIIEMTSNSTCIVWEIKHAANIPEARAVQAKTQAAQYVGRSKNGLTITDLGHANRFQGSFVIEVESSYYEITYHTPQKGVILYTVKETKKRKENPFAVFVPSYATVPVSTTVQERNAYVFAGMMAVAVMFCCPLSSSFDLCY